MEKREKITLHMNQMDVLIAMAEGNPGAISAMTQLLEDPAGLFDVLHLDDMNMRGPQIWVGFKDFAGQDVGKFREAIRKRDPEMVAIVNRECPDQKATQHGASYRR